MARLREKQMQRRKLEILRAGKELFAAKGYQATTVEEIAEGAEVALGTVYRHYKSKADILLSILQQNMKEILQKGVEFLNDLPSDFVEAASGLLNTYFEELIYRYNYRTLLKEIMVMVAEQPVYTEEMIKLDLSIVAQLADLVGQFQRRNLITTEIKPEEVANLIYPSTFFTFELYVFDIEKNLDTMKSQVQHQVQIILRGLRP
jgi:AcrR family transcriptional regulator